MDYGGNNGGGGFNYSATDPMQGGGGGGTPTSGGGASPNKRKAYDEQTLIPITIRMALNAQTHNTPGGGSEGFILPNNGGGDGRVLHAVKIVAAVRDVSEQSTSVSYDLEDGTGLITVKQWHDQQENSGITEMRMECKEKAYVRVIGQLREYDGHRHIVAHGVRRVSTPNEVTHHFLECIASAERHRRGGLGPKAAGGVGASANNGGVKGEFGGNPVYDRPPQAQQGVNGGGGAPLRANGGGGAPTGDGCDEVVVEYIRAHGRSDIGADVNDMIADVDMRFPGKFTAGRIQKAVEQLAVDGHIYSTVDESKYKYAED